eukprot:2326485-Prymnesium_polylepis.1
MARCCPCLCPSRLWWTDADSVRSLDARVHRWDIINGAFGNDLTGVPWFIIGDEFSAGTSFIALTMRQLFATLPRYAVSFLTLENAWLLLAEVFESSHFVTSIKHLDIGVLLAGMFQLRFLLSGVSSVLRLSLAGYG